MNRNLNPVLEAQLEAILEAHWPPGTERPTRCAIPTTSTEAWIIRLAAEPWQRDTEAMRRHEARQRWLMAGFAVACVLLAIIVTRGH